MFLTVLYLGEDGPQPGVGSVRLQQEGAVEVRGSEHRLSGESLLHLLKGLALGGSPGKLSSGCPFLVRSVRGAAREEKSGIKTTIVSRQSQESPYLGFGGGPWGREDSCHLILLGFYESSAHPEPQVLCLVEGQVTFSGIGGQPGPAQLHEHPPQPLQVVFPGLRMNDDVIQVGRGVGLVGPQQDVHQSLEGGGSPVQAEGKNPILPVPTGGGEGGLRLRVIRQGHLPIALREVQRGHVSGPPQPIQQLVYPRHGVSVEFGDLVQAAEVVAKAEGAIRFWDHDYGAGPWAARGLDYP